QRKSGDKCLHDTSSCLTGAAMAARPVFRWRFWRKKLLLFLNWLAATGTILLFPPMREHSAPAAASLRPHQRQRMLRDHQFFVGGDHPDRRGAAGRGNLRPIPGIRLLVQFDAEPCQVPAKRSADARRMLADPGRKHERVEAAEHGGVGAGEL